MPLLARLERALERHAARPAVEGAQWLLSYRDLDFESARVAAALRAAGVRPGQIVPMLMGRSAAFVVAVLALLRCGAVYAPIDGASPPARRSAMLAALGSSTALVDAGVSGAGLEGLNLLCIDDLLRCPPPGSTPMRWPSPQPDAPLYAMFTSGSTGAPKAVLVPRRAVARLVCDADFAAMRADARWALCSSLAFDASTLELWAPLLNGGCCVVQPLPQPSLDELADFLLRRRISDAWLTSALFNAVVDDRPDALGGLRQLLTGGERVSVAHARACLVAWPRLRLINGYGPTENTTFSLCHTVTLADLADGATQVPIGRPVRGTTARVASAEGAALPAGEAGELWVGGEGLALGYLNDAALTAARFVQRDAQRWYRTGDQVRCRSDGVHEFLGRNDRQVKIAGHRIELDEVERVLGSCPGVGDAVVLVLGEQAHERHLAGCYTGRAGAAPDEAVVAEWLAQQLPPAALPQRLQRLQQLPLNLNGKADRAALAARLVDTGAGCAAPADTPDAPHSDAERQVAAAWMRCLGSVAPGRQSHFMRCGGGSLLALRVAADLSRCTGRRVEPLDLLRNPVLADQALLLQRAALVAADDGAHESGAERMPLSRSAQSLVRAGALDASASACLVHVAWHVPARLRAATLRRAFDRLVRRHPMLRTAAALHGDRVDAQVLPALPAHWWTWREGQSLPPRDGWPERFTPIVNRPLDLVRDGPMRVDCWSLPDGSHLCVWTVHHFAIDEAAIDHALDELDRLCRGDSLPPPYGSPAAFARLEQAACDETGVLEQATLAARVLAGQTLPLPLPPGPGTEFDMPLPEAVGARLMHVCQDRGCTPFAALLVACALAQQQVFGAAWRFVLTPFSRRAEPELVEPVGYLLDLRLIEAGARSGETVVQTLARVQAQVQQAQQLRFRPLERLAAAVDAIAPGSAVALTQFALTWRQHPQRGRGLGGASVSMLRVPRQGARFGIALHLEDTPHGLCLRVEAVQAAVEDGRAAALARAFVQQLECVCGAQASLIDGAALPPALPADEPLADHTRALAQAAWRRWLGHAPDGDDAHFLRAGGSSLLAMRLAATLRREGGFSLDVGAFLAQPTFAALCGLLGRRAAADPDTVTLIGPRNFDSVTLVLPGMQVGALGMFTLAQELHARLDAGSAVAIVDTDAILRLAPATQRAQFMARQLQQVVRDLGETRVASVVGYSVGGALGIDLFSRMGPAWAARVPLWLLDTYAPRHTSMALSTKARRALVSLLRHPTDASQRLVQQLRARRTALTDSARGAGQVLRTQWNALLAELAGAAPEAAGIHARLIHSRGAARSAGVWRHACSNGFDPGSFASLRVHDMDGGHHDLRSTAAAQVAALIAGTADAPEAGRA